MSGPENNPRGDEPIDREEYEKWERELDTHKLGTCLRFANGETCVGCGDALNGVKLTEAKKGGMP